MQTSSLRLAVGRRSFGGRVVSRFAGITSLLLAVVFGGQLARAQSGAVADRIVQAVVPGKVSTLKGSVHPQARSEFDQGLVAGSLPLHGLSIDFARTAAQQASLAALLKAQQDPSSPKYRQWLTTEQFAAQFGMSPQDIAKVTSWLESQGFKVDKVADSRNAIRFSGTAALVEGAFRTQIHKYTVNGENHFANSTEVALPSAFAGTVVRVGGLNDFKPRAHIARRGVVAKPQFTSGASGGHFLAPGDFAVIYDLNPLYTGGFTGKGQTIGIVGQTDIVPADITSFRSAAGLSANDPTVYLIAGSADPGISYGDLTETDLDLEWSGGVAPDASIVLVNSTNVLDSLQFAIENKINGLLIPILSSSYGNCEIAYSPSDIQSLEASFQQANSQGQTVINATGDTGAADCDYTPASAASPVTSAIQGLQVDYPASSAYVTGLGGSEFSADGSTTSPSTGADQYWSANGSNDVITSALSYIPEMAWNDTAFEILNGGGLSAGGGGASSLFTKPTWQAGVAGIPSDGARDVPDLALTASPDHDPYLICTQVQLDSGGGAYSSSCVNGFRISDPGDSVDDGHLTAVGGTSAAAPTFAGILAVLEQKLGTPQGLGNINPALYTLASNSTTYASAFHDITTGDNIVPCTTGSTDCPSDGQFGFSAGTGYDQATGLGSVDATNLATAFGSIATQAGSTTTLALTPATPVVGATVTLTATVTPNTGTTTPTGTVTFTVDSNLPVTAPLTAGVATTTTSFSTGGSHTVTVAYSGDTDFYASNTTSTFTVSAAPTAAPTTTTLTANPTPINIGGALTLTASVQSATAGTLAGTVTFTLGGTTVGTAAVSSGASGTGTATLQVSAATAALGFTPGSDTIVASYGGDSTYASSNGSTTITVNNPQIAMAVPNMTISSASPGHSGSSTITLTSTGGYAGTVQLTASASSLNANYAISPTSVALTSGGSGTATISIETIATSLQRGVNGNLRKSTTANNHVIAGAAAAFGCLFLLGIPGFRKRRWPALAALLMLAGLGTAIGCGGGSSGASPAGNYTVTVTATDSANSAITTSTTFTVTIQ